MTTTPHTSTELHGPAGATRDRHGQANGQHNGKLRVFVYHHTHWDREWWATYQDFRFRLVELMDELLETLERDPEFHNFFLDGQTIVLKDYLEIRPEQRQRLVDYIKAGRIDCGPWYILPDEYLVSGEAHIRNLWLGERVAEQLGISNQRLGYIPDTFGHISQMPQILRGFEIDNALIWRGLGGDESFKQVFLWEAPDGSRVLTHWFPDGYYQMPFLHLENPQKPHADRHGRVEKVLAECGPRAIGGNLLLPYGGDHQLIDPRLPRLLRTSSEQFKEQAEILWATPRDYIEALRAEEPELEVLHGEQRRFGLDMPHLLPGVLSTRLYLKQLNFQGQLWLERYAEPFSALAWLQGRRYDQGMLWTAWELLVQNHPHDSICGCSIDQVHREMLPRFDQSRQIAEIVTAKSVQHINARIDTSSLPEEAQPLVVHNPLPWTRSDVVKLLLPRGQAVHPRTHVLRDPEGKELPFQVRDVDSVRPMTDQWQYTEVRFIANEVPGLGYQLFSLARREADLHRHSLLLARVEPAAKRKGNERLSDLRVGDGVLENRYLRVEVNRQDGTLTVVDKFTGQRYAGLNAFEDGGDAGDEYNYAAPLADQLLRSTSGARVHVSLAEAGYASATLRIDLDWALPRGLAADRLSRAPEYVAVRISSFVTLAAGARRVEVRSEWHNPAGDHRLRALFPLGAMATASHAEGHFDVLERPVQPQDRGHGWQEPYVSTMPQQGYVSVSNNQRGLTIANRGLPEFEVLPDGTGTVALTLLRAVGWISRDDILSRIGGAGPQTPTPEAQCLGHCQAEYAIIPHSGDWLEAQSYQLAHEYLAGLYGSTTDRHPGELPRRGGLIELLGDHTLLLSACKRAERAETLILRFWNVAKQPTAARVRLSQAPAQARLVNLKEQPLPNGQLELAEDGSFVVEAGPAQIVTLEIKF